MNLKLETSNSTPEPGVTRNVRSLDFATNCYEKCGLITFVGDDGVLEAGRVLGPNGTKTW